MIGLSPDSAELRARQIWRGKTAHGMVLTRSTVVLLVIALLGVGLRAFIYLKAGTLRLGVDPDEGVNFGSSLLLIDGYRPYQDFVLLHPPGASVLLAPLALLAGLCGTDVAFVCTRVLFLLLGGINIVLVGRLADKLGAGRGGARRSVGLRGLLRSRHR